jgi:hypothetical protein
VPNGFFSGMSKGRVADIMGQTRGGHDSAEVTSL